MAKKIKKLLFTAAVSFGSVLLYRQMEKLMAKKKESSFEEEDELEEDEAGGYEPQEDTDVLDVSEADVEEIAEPEEEAAKPQTDMQDGENETERVSFQTL